MPARDTLTNKQPKETRKKSNPRKLSDLHLRPATKTEMPEYIKSLELLPLYPFTIYDAQEKGGDYGKRIFFSLAYKNATGEVVKRIWTPSANDERIQLMREVKRSPIIGCRLIEVPTNGRYDYFKVISVDDDVDKIINDAVAELETETNGASPSTTRDADIPF